MIPLSCPTIGKEEIAAVTKVLKSGWLGMGVKVKEFEEVVKMYIGAKHAIAVNTCTSALHLSLVAAGIGYGDEVIVPSLTYVATVMAIIQAGAMPVFADVEESTLNLSIEDVVKKITSKTKAIIPVHFTGQPCEMEELLYIGSKYNIRIIEDAAHAFGSLYKGKKIGSFGDIVCFSFDPVKLITCGEGGMIVTTDEKIAAKAKLKRNLGINKETYIRYKENKILPFYHVVTGGFRYQLSDINAAIGLAQIEKVEKFIRRRQEIVKKYDSEFKKYEEIKLLHRDYDSTAFLYYVIRVPKRDELITYLKSQGITAGVHYYPNHLQPYFREFYQHLPITERVAKEIITLPLYSHMTDQEVEYVIEKVISFVRKCKK